MHIGGGCSGRLPRLIQRHLRQLRPPRPALLGRRLAAATRLHCAGCTAAATRGPFAAGLRFGGGGGGGGARHGRERSAKDVKQRSRRDALLPETGPRSAFTARTAQR